MWLILLLILGGALLVSGLIAGVVRSIQKVYGYSAPLLFGDPERNYELGLLPVFILKTGVFSSIGVWGLLLIRFRNTDSDTIISGIGLGMILALAHILLVGRIQQFKRMNSGITGILVGMIIGVIGGAISAALITQDAFADTAGIFVLVGMVIGGIVGGVNGMEVGKVFTSNIYKKICNEIAGGAVLIGLCSGLFVACNPFMRVSDPFEWIMVLTTATIAGGLFGGIIIITRFVGLLLSRIVSSIISSLLILLKSGPRRRKSTSIQQTKRLHVFRFLALAATIVIISTPMISFVVRFHLLSTFPSEWVSIFGGNDLDEVRVIEIDQDGGYIVGGYTFTSSNYWFSPWVFKLNTQGQLVWEHAFVSSDSEIRDIVDIIQITPDGGYIVAGGGQHSWIFKLNAQGQLVWTCILRVTNYSGVNAIRITPEGGYIVVVKETSSRDMGEYDMWIFKLDSQGRQIWKHTFKLESPFQITPDGGYVVTRYTKSSKTSMIKFDTQGQKIWEYAFADNRYDHDGVSSIHVTSDEGYIVAGYSRTLNQRKEDRWILRLNSQGQQVWKHIFSRHNNDSIHVIQATPDGGCVVAGDTKSKGTKGIDTWWVFKLNAQGESMWKNTFGGSHHDRMYGIQLAADGGYIGVGDTWSSKGTEKMNEWISKFDVQGHQIWKYTFSENRDCRADLIQITPDGGVCLAGFTGNVCILKLDGQGRRVWDKTFGRNDGALNNLYAQSERVWEQIFFISSLLLSNANTTKLRIPGTGYTFDGNSINKVHDIQITRDGGLLIAGYTSKLAEDERRMDGSRGRDAWIVKFKPENLWKE